MGCGGSSGGAATAASAADSSSPPAGEAPVLSGVAKVVLVWMARQASPSGGRQRQLVHTV